MISSASSSDRAGRPEPISAGDAAVRAKPPTRDRISTEQAAFLRAELDRQPEIRPDVVARARRLVADPQYPGPSVMADVAHQILGAPDLSDVE